MNANNKTLKEWGELENSVQLLMWQGGNYAEDWLKFAYHNALIK
mgnify:CR=1 FL=1|jgi:hypothetical protein